MNDHRTPDLHWPENPAERLLTGEEWTRISQALSLTRREQQVAEKLLNGLTRDEIAEALDLSPRTVRQHMEMLHSKLDVTNRVGVVLRLISIRDQLAGQFNGHRQTKGGERK